MKYLTNIYKSSLGIGVVLLSLTSCSDFLDQQPDERVEVNTEEKVINLVKTAYTSGNYGVLAELASDNLIDNNTPHLPWNPNDKDQVTSYYNLPPYNQNDEQAFTFEPVRAQSQQDSPLSVWSGNYSAIATDNHALEAIDKLVAQNGGVMSDKLRAARAEALISRAYHHFILVNMFCQVYKDSVKSKDDIGIPYSTTPETTVDPKYNRGTVAEVYDKIQADLEEGLKDISDVNMGSTPKWRFNVNASHAFAARFYLFKREYDKVIEHADAVLGVGTANLPNMLMNIAKFEGCTDVDDYANVWQNPDEPNNLLLIATNSLAFRHFVGYRYTCNSLALRNTVGNSGPNASTFPRYFYMTTGGAYFAGGQDYGLISSKIGERFEYTDKVAGIGYPHTIRREFTSSALLLERAEAKVLSKNQDIDGAVADLIAYENSHQTFSEADKQSYIATGQVQPLTRAMIERYYKAGSTSPNCFQNWDFTKQVSSQFVVPENAVVYMNCINDMRRVEFLFEGNRFFDLKRWGITIEHQVGNPARTITVNPGDPRLAFELPQEVLSAGLEPSRPLDLSGATQITISSNK